MKKLSILIAAALSAGCSAVITAPQNITEVSEIDREYVQYNHGLGSPTVEMRSFFDVSDVEINEEKELVLTGHFSIINKKFQADTNAVMVFDIELENMGDDRVMVSKLVAKDLSLFSVHKPIESTVHQVFKDMSMVLTHELKGEIIEGQTRLGVANKVNEIVKR